MTGHIFVTRGDLRRLNCDAWLLPTDGSFEVTDRWLEEPAPQSTSSFNMNAKEWAVPTARLRERIKQQKAIGWGEAERVVRLDGDVREPAEPAIYLVNTGSSAGESVAWYMAGVRQFVETAARDLGGLAHVTRRSRPLLGLPLVGTGAGGAKEVTGHVMRDLLETLWEADAHDVDIALVLDKNEAFAAAQHERLYPPDDAAGGRRDPWPELDDTLCKHADHLAAYAVSGALVLFVGAGVSQGAGLPDWATLLDELALDAGMSDAEREALKTLHVLDWARIVERRLIQAGRPLGKTVCGRIAGAWRYSLAHSLLAALPVKEAVTTNYDTLFEQAADAADPDSPVTVLPYQRTKERKRWLLKMHGCVSHPQDIVLTRADYLRYANRRAALAGIVQALLITRHMLFVGFSLSDDNFHRIVDEVRRALRDETPMTGSGKQPDHASVDPFGTALLQELWRDDLDLVPVMDGGEAITMATCARRLEIFLDYLLAKATSAVLPLLDHRFDGLLTDEQREIQGILRELEARVPSTTSSSAAWKPIHELLARYRGKS